MNPVEPKLRARLAQLVKDWESEADEWKQQPWVRKSLLNCASDLRQTLEETRP